MPPPPTGSSRRRCCVWQPWLAVSGCMHSQAPLHLHGPRAPLKLAVGCVYPFAVVCSLCVYSACNLCAHSLSFPCVHSACIHAASRSTVYSAHTHTQLLALHCTVVGSTTNSIHRAPRCVCAASRHRPPTLPRWCATPAHPPPARRCCWTWLTVGGSTTLMKCCSRGSWGGGSRARCSFCQTCGRLGGCMWCRHGAAGWGTVWGLHVDDCCKAALYWICGAVTVADTDSTLKQPRYKAIYKS